MKKLIINLIIALIFIPLMGLDKVINAGKAVINWLKNNINK